MKSIIRTSEQTQSIYSHQNRKENLWNVQEPGDPYDIRKSMIAKLPGAKVFMGQHLEFICLFQAAQIQRLSQFLEKYKYKLKQCEVMNLDRHSYQIQIKELTEKLSEEANLKNQITKCRTYIDRQDTQIKQLQQIIRASQSIDPNFKKLLDQYDLNLKNIAAQNNDLREQLRQSREQKQILENLNQAEIDKFVREHNVNSKPHTENTLLLLVQSQLKKLQFEMKKLKDQNLAKNQQIQRLRLENYQKGKGVSVKDTPQNNQTTQSKIKLSQSQKQITILKQQIQRLKLQSIQRQSFERQKIQYQKNIQLYDAKLKESEIKLKDNLSEISSLNFKVSILQKQVKDQSYFLQYQSRIKMLTSQIQNLHQKIKQEAINSKAAHQRAQRLALENQHYKINSRQRNDSIAINENNQLKRQLTISESSRAILSQQIQRLKELLNNKANQVEQKTALSYQNQILKSKIRQVESILINRYQSQIVRLKNEFEHRVTTITQGNNNQLQSRVFAVEKELDQHRDLLKGKKQQLDKQRIAYQTLQLHYNKLEGQSLSKTRNYDVNLNSLKIKNEEVNQKNRQIGELQKRILQFQNKFNRMEIQFQRLTALVHTREEENAQLLNKLRQVQSYTKYHDLQSSHRLAGAEQNINIFKNQNDELRKKIAELINENSKKSTQSVNQISRLTVSLRTLQDQKFQLQNIHRQINQQLDFARQSIVKSSKDNQQLRKSIMQIQKKHISFLNDSNLGAKGFQAQNQSLKRQIIELKTSIVNYESDLARRVAIHDQNVNLLTKDNDELRKRLRQTQTIMVKYNLQHQSLSQKYKQKCDQHSVTQINIRNITLDNQNLRKYMKEQEMAVSSKHQAEILRNFRNYQSVLQSTHRQLEDQGRKLSDLQIRYSKLNQQYEKLGLNFNNVILQLQNARKQLAQKENLAINIETDAKAKISNYEANLNNLTRSQQDTQRRLTEQDFILKQKFEENSRLEVNYKSLIQQNENLKKRYKQLQISIGQKLEGEVAQRYTYYEQTIMKINKQNQQQWKKNTQLNNQLTKRLAQINNLTPITAEKQVLKKKLQTYQFSIASYEAEVNRRLATLQQTIQTLTRQNEQLKKRLQEGSDLSRKVGKQSEQRANTLVKQLEKMNFNIRNLQKENSQLKRKIVQLGDLRRVLTQLQAKFALTSQQLERVNGNLRTKCEQYNKLQLKNRNVILDLQTVRKQIDDANKKYHSYEQAISDLRRKVYQLQQKHQNLSSDHDRLGSSLKVKHQESSQILSTYKMVSTQYEEYKRRVKQAQAINIQNLSNSKRENDELKRKLQQFDTHFRQFGQDSQRMNAEYSNKSKIMASQIERLNLNIVSKNQQLQRNRKQFKQYQMSMSQRVEVEIKNKITLQNIANGLSRENQDLKRKLQQYGDVHRKAVQFEGNLKVNAQQFQKMGNYIRVRDEQFAKLDFAYKAIIKDNQDLRRKLQQLSEIIKKIPQYDQKLSTTTRQYQKLQQAFNNKAKDLANAEITLRQFSVQIQNYKRQNVDLQRSLISRYEGQINTRSLTFEQNLLILKNQRQQLFKKKADYQNKIGLLTTQIERLNILVKSRTDELQLIAVQSQTQRQAAHRKILSNQSQLTTLQSNLKRVTSQCQQAKKHLFQYQGNINNLYSEFQRLQNIINQLEEKNHFLSDQIQRLTEENNDLEGQTKDIRLRLSDESSLQKRINQHLSLMVILFTQIQSLRQRVTDKEKQVISVRRASLSPHIMKH